MDREVENKSESLVTNGQKTFAGIPTGQIQTIDGGGNAQEQSNRDSCLINLTLTKHILQWTY
jgi:hypothetical protein